MASKKTDWRKLATANYNENFAKLWVISFNGSYAWEWARPANRVIFSDCNVSADVWKESMLAAGNKISDDRGAVCGNVWD